MTAVANEIDYARIGRILLHSTARAVLEEMARRHPEPVSPKQISLVAFDELANVAYHVRALQRLGLIQAHHTEPRRGAVEHFYTLTEETIA